jgi:hypothetical protein
MKYTLREQLLVLHKSSRDPIITSENYTSNSITLSKFYYDPRK